jgi:hypothetical protein
MGLFIVGYSARFDPEVVPWYGIIAGMLLGAGVAFSTVVRGLLREFLPFLNRRGEAALAAENTDSTQHMRATPLVKRRKSDA